MNVHAVIRHADPAFEADGKEQVDREGLGRGLGDGKIRACKRGGETESKGQYDGG